MEVNVIKTAKKKSLIYIEKYNEDIMKQQKVKYLQHTQTYVQD